MPLFRARSFPFQRLLRPSHWLFRRQSNTSKRPVSEKIWRTMSAAKPPSPSSTSDAPRPSASLVIVNDRNEVLLVHRNPKARHFAGVHVFPGGNFDKRQDSSLQITAIRETFEESGLLLASKTSPPLSTPLPEIVLDQARREIHGQRMLFRDFLSSNNLRPDVKSLLPFTQWITPPNNLRRFHTQFYVVFLPASPSAGFSSGAKQDVIPKPDGGQEVVSARFLHPDDALAEFREKKIAFMPPQFYILYTLAEILTGRQNLAEQRERVRTLSQGLFGRMVMNPRSLLSPGSDGRITLTYEGDETRGGSKGRLHRALVRTGKGGITSEITLQRNFDIFSEIESEAFNIPSKL